MNNDSFDISRLKKPTVRSGCTATCCAMLRTRLVFPIDGRAAITIVDRGVGIDARDLSRVFDPYFTTKRGGTGLGLPIAKNIVEGLGGTITVSSDGFHPSDAGYALIADRFAKAIAAAGIALR